MLCPHPADPTLTTDNLMEVVKGVEDHWNNLSRRLRVPRSKRLEIRRNYQSNCQRMGALVDYYMGSPTKSWKAIARALQLIKLPKQADEVTTRYIQGMDVNRVMCLILIQAVDCQLWKLLSIKQCYL